MLGRTSASWKFCVPRVRLSTSTRSPPTASSEGLEIGNGRHHAQLARGLRSRDEQGTDHQRDADQNAESASVTCLMSLLCDSTRDRVMTLL